MNRNEELENLLKKIYDIACDSIDVPERDREASQSNAICQIIDIIGKELGLDLKEIFD